VVDFNSRWLNALSSRDMIRLASRCTLARILERDDFATRYREERPIALHELLYPLMQAYDSVALETDVEMGGTDQTFNLLMGRTLQSQYGQEPQCVLTMPLLEGLDGVRKMSKSYGNYIGINEPPAAQFGKTMSISDELMWRYYELLSGKSLEEIADMRRRVEAGGLHPKLVKEELALEIVGRFHGETEAGRAREEFNAVFTKGGWPEDTPVHSCQAGEASSPAVFLAGSGLAASRGEAKRLVAQGSLTVNDEKWRDALTPLPAGEYTIKLGKKRFLLLTVR
jgi:tyrosyl-tRNA synthetase